ncbi:MAG: Asp/Glu racemase [Pseudomonadota bacterium]
MTLARSGPKIGVLVPYTNVNLEPDMAMLMPPGVTCHFERMGGYDAGEIPGSDQMAGLGASDLSETLRLIAGVRPAAVLYGCTSATLTHGPAFDRSLAENIKRASGALSITAAGALVAGIKRLGAARVGFASPYLGEINDQAVAFLQSEGIATVARADIRRALGNYGQGELTPGEVYDLALRADGPEVQALVLSCTDMRSVEVIARLEAVTGKPVVTSNQAMAAALCAALGLPKPRGFGRLFDIL